MEITIGMEDKELVISDYIIIFFTHLVISPEYPDNKVPIDLDNVGVHFENDDPVQQDKVFIL